MVQEPLSPLDRSRTALVLIEYQREWLDADGKINRLMTDRPQFEAALERSKRLIDGAREAGLAIVHVGLAFTPGHPELGKAALGLRGAIPKFGTFVGRGAEFVPPFDPRPGEFVVSGRVGASGFAGSNLDAYLRNQRIDTILLAGFALHVCAESTFRQAHDLGYAAIIVEDATAAFTADQRRHVLDDVVHHYGAAASVDEVLVAISSTAVGSAPIMRRLA
jgi:nicotinamidase-related amidase